MLLLEVALILGVHWLHGAMNFFGGLMDNESGASTDRNTKMLSFKARWIVSFLTVAELKSMTKTAGLLGIDRASVSRDVKYLEHWLSRVLFNNNIDYELTEYGEKFRLNAQTVVDLMLSSCAEASDFSN